MLVRHRQFLKRGERSVEKAPAEGGVGIDQVVTGHTAECQALVGAEKSLVRRYQRMYFLHDGSNV